MNSFAAYACAFLAIVFGIAGIIALYQGFFIQGIAIIISTAAMAVNARTFYILSEIE